MTSATGRGGSARLEWEREGRDWPLRASSRFVEAAGLTWHVQRAGTGVPILLVHGTGSTTHTWRSLIPRLCVDFELIAFDLPGHGFSDPARPADYTLPGMSKLVADLLRVLRLEPQIAVGHSAGAAILCRMCLDGLLEPKRIVSLNGALLPFRGGTNRLFKVFAHALAESAIPARFVARHVRGTNAIDALLHKSGSRLDSEDVELYRRIASSPEHVRAALRMMAGWELDVLARDLPRLATPITLVVGDRDRFVRPAEADHVARLNALTHRVVIRGAGHLVHEERPDAVEALVRSLSEARTPTPSSP